MDPLSHHKTKAWELNMTHSRVTYQLILPGFTRFGVFHYCSGLELISSFTQLDTSIASFVVSGIHELLSEKDIVEKWYI